jgi:hypothetical protein
MSLLSINSFRPNRITDTKDKKYHLEYAKWCVNQGENHLHSEWLSRTNVNKRFYKNDQWIEDEDLEAFLKDTSGNERNRIRITKNVIRPMVEQYRGNAIALSINATAKSISPLANNRREAALNKQLLKSDVANAFPEIGAILKNADPTIGDTEEETSEIFNNLYQDTYVEKMNYLLNYVEELNKLPNMKSRLAQNLALSGLGVTECFNHGGHRRYSVIEAEDFIFDRDAREYDLSDASFMGKKVPMDMADVMEKYQNMEMEEKIYLENLTRQGSEGYTSFTSDTMRNFSVGRVPVYEMYWKDSEVYEYGWIMDEFQYPSLVRINEKGPNGEPPKYTDKDLIDYPDTPRNRALFKGKKKRKLSVDVVRYCSFIPSQYAPKINGNDSSDIVLEYGMLDYQDTDYLDISNVKFPFKAFVWGYVNGEVFSPVDDAINPQRFINRVLSVFESQVNNSGGSNLIIDEDAIDPQDKDTIYSDISDGKAITVKTKGRGVPNTVGYYDATPKAGTMKMLEIVPMLNGFVQEMTGVNEALKGESMGSDQLVGVTQLLIQRGSLMQEAFYEALAQIFIQVYQDIASVGKRFYIDHERELAIAAGDDAIKTFKLTEDMKSEDFRVFVKRDNDDDMLKSQANQILTMFMEAQLIDRTTFINLYGRSTPDQVLKALRDNERFKMELERQQAEQQQEQEQKMMLQQEAMAAQQQVDQLDALQLQDQAEKERRFQEKENELEKITTKGLVEMAKQDVTNQNQQNQTNY